MRAKLSVIITAFNEERNISDCIDSVLWADEILLVDSFSTDRTVEIAKASPKVTVLQRQYVYPADQKNWAIEQVSYPYVLILDADERVTPELRREIEDLLLSPAGDSGAVAYSIARRSVFLGKEIRYSGWQNDRVVRLFAKGCAKYADKKVHEEMIASGPLGFLSARLTHKTTPDLATYLAKMQRYTYWAAQDRALQGRSSSLLLMVSRPAWVFIKSFFLRLGFLDGLHGFVLCSLSAVSEYIKMLRLWEINRANDER